MIADKTQNKSIDLVCLSHLRWSFVFQRPQHLMSRFARIHRVYFVEEPIYEAVDQSALRSSKCPRTGVVILTPHLPESYRGERAQNVVWRLLSRFMMDEDIQHYIAWFYTPMALDFAAGLKPALTVYDCMDELSLFRGAPPRLCDNETELLRRADLVFTGGVSLFEAKQNRHANVYPFPSGVDVFHFAQARALRDSAEDQAQLPRPRIGYAGVIDERIDLPLIDELSRQRPDWQIVMVGPVVKIDPASLPRRQNLHWLGMKDYRDLPQYFAGWDAAMLPFALNESTRFISPTKTPEYLAAGLPVVSTPIRDVVHPFGDLGLVHIANNAEEFIRAIEQSMACGFSMKWRERADGFLRTLSWDDTWKSMARLIEEAITRKTLRPAVMAAAGQSGLPESEERAAHV